MDLRGQPESGLTGCGLWPVQQKRDGVVGGGGGMRREILAVSGGAVCMQVAVLRLLGEVWAWSHELGCG